MSPAAAYFSVRETGFPRVSGDEPESGLSGGAGLVFSPRERG